MLNLVDTKVKLLRLSPKILEAAYELYAQAPQADYPVIDLRELANQTGASLLECRNAIVEANQIDRFPNCSLHS